MESLRFIGFKRIAAESILQRFHSALVEHWNMGIDFYSFVEAFLDESPENVFERDDDWNAVLKRMGIRKEVRIDILNPDYDHIRLSRSAKDWAIETIKDGWIFLTRIDKAVKKNEIKIKNGISKEWTWRQSKTSI